jgi:diguanylate cyclase
MLKLLRRPPLAVSSSAAHLTAPGLASSEAHEVPGAATHADTSDPAEAVSVLLDAVAGLLHAVGRYALDTETLSQHQAQVLMDRWRRHVTVGLDHPDEGPAATDAQGDSAIPRRGVGVTGRDWAGMLRFVVGHQRGARERTMRVHDELRDTVWCLVRGLADVVGAEAENARTTESTVQRVRDAVSEASPEQLRATALGAVGEIAALAAQRERARREQVAVLGEEIVRLGAALEEARREGAVDPLTGFGNRRAFDEALAHVATLNALWGQTACLVVFDVDGFKAVNDAGGHPAGDEALRGIAADLTRVFLRRGDTLCRFGGDEFAAVLRDTTAAEATRLAQRVVTAVAARSAAAAANAPEGTRVAVYGVSAGIAELTDGESATAWLKRAERALRQAKDAGRGRVTMG